MAAGDLGGIVQHLGRAVLRCDGAGLSDGELLECYLARRDPAAFEALVRRHGPMVLGVCRRVLRHGADAEDAFQARFLVLVRKAASVYPRGRVGNWLYGVAYHTALKARAMDRKRRIKEKQAAQAPPPGAPEDDWQQLHELLDQELSRLPDRYRVPIVLCDLEGRPIKEAARQLGWPQGTVASRLSRGRSLLARRMARHGTALTAAALSAALAHEAASAGVSAPLVAVTVRLTKGVLNAMLLTKLKNVTVVLLAGAVVGLAAGALVVPR